MDKTAQLEALKVALQLIETCMEKTAFGEINNNMTKIISVGESDFPQDMFELLRDAIQPFGVYMCIGNDYLTPKEQALQGSYSYEIIISKSKLSRQEIRNIYIPFLKEEGTL